MESIGHGLSYVLTFWSHYVNHILHLYLVQYYTCHDFFILSAGARIPKRGEKIKQATGAVEALKQLDVRMITR